MIKLLLAVILVPPLLLLQGCVERDGKEVKGEIKTRCIDGVSYYLFKEAYGTRTYGFMAPKYNRAGTLSLCEDSGEGLK